MVATDTYCITGIFCGCLFSAVFWNMKNPQKLKSQNILKLPVHAKCLIGCTLKCGQYGTQ